MGGRGRVLPPPGTPCGGGAGPGSRSGGAGGAAGPAGSGRGGGGSSSPAMGERRPGRAARGALRCSAQGRRGAAGAAPQRAQNGRRGRGALRGGGRAVRGRCPPVPGGRQKPAGKGCEGGLRGGEGAFAGDTWLQPVTARFYYFHEYKIVVVLKQYEPWWGGWGNGRCLQIGPSAAAVLG